MTTPPLHVLNTSLKHRVHMWCAAPAQLNTKPQQDRSSVLVVLEVVLLSLHERYYGPSSRGHPQAHSAHALQGQPGVMHQLLWSTPHQGWGGAPVTLEIFSFLHLHWNQIKLNTIKLLNSLANTTSLANITVSNFCQFWCGNKNYFIPLLKFTTTS